MNFIRTIFFVIISALVGYGAWRTYHYACDAHVPTISLGGIQSDGHYAGEMSCTLSGSDPYKVAQLSVWLDDNPLVSNYAVNSGTFEHGFSIPTKTLPHGKHTLKAEVTNSTYRAGCSTLQCDFYIDNTPLQAAFVRPDSEYKVFQGRTLHVQFQVNKEIDHADITLFSNTYACLRESKNSKIYECFVPITCEEAPNEYAFSIDIVDKVGNVVTLENKFQVILFPFKKQTLHVSSQKVQEEKEIGRPQEDLERELEQLAALSPQEKLWSGTFYAPIEITGISTEYGCVRTTQERGRYAHKAVDILNTPRSVVWSTQDGRVVIKDRYVHSGNTIVVDHGYGILSLFFHLEEFAEGVEVGDIIKRGNPIGTLGKTGYASGYHLHWEMRINNVPVDPMQWIKPNF